MIVKYFDLKKNIIQSKKFFLLYGKNEGLIEETIKNSLKPILPKNVFNYEEKEILDDNESFKENLINKSFFDNEKLIIIKRTTDKLFKLIFELKFTKQLVILLPPKNCKAPNKDPLWISSPEMPTLCKKDDPSTA